MKRAYNVRHVNEVTLLVDAATRLRFNTKVLYLGPNEYTVVIWDSTSPEETPPYKEVA